jgi:hypothetical protein
MRIGFILGDPTIQFCPLLVREREEIGLALQAVPELANRFEPLGGGQAEQFLKMGIRHRWNLSAGAYSRKRALYGCGLTECASAAGAQARAQSYASIAALTEAAARAVVGAPPARRLHARVKPLALLV